MYKNLYFIWNEIRVNLQVVTNRATTLCGILLNYWCKIFWNILNVAECEIKRLKIC